MASYLYYSVAAGLLAAMASLFGKLAFEGDTLASCLSWAWRYAGVPESATVLGGLVGLAELKAAAQAASFGLIFLCNALMVNFSSKSLDLCASAVLAVVTSTGLNFFFSAAFGFLFFGEPLNLQWVVGASFILVGLWFINAAAKEGDEKPKDE